LLAGGEKSLDVGESLSGGGEKRSSVGENLLGGGENMMLGMILLKVLTEGFFCLVDIFWDGLTVLGEEGGSCHPI
jgi:hypothetical protein